MLNKLIPNRELTLPGFDQSAPGPNPAFPTDFANVPNRTYNIAVSNRVGVFDGTRRSAVQAGAHPNAAKQHRTFRWLPWVLGKVSCVQLAGSDILTGTMSGCWLVIFDLNGTDYAGHIGTDTDPNTPNSLQAKAAWRNAVNAGHITPNAAFNPVGAALPMGALNTHGESPEFYGAFEPNGNVYTVVLTIPGHGGNLRRIASVHAMPTTADVTAF